MLFFIVFMILSSPSVCGDGEEGEVMEVLSWTESSIPCAVGVLHLQPGCDEPTCMQQITQSKLRALSNSKVDFSLARDLLASAEGALLVNSWNLIHLDLKLGVIISHNHRICDCGTSVDTSSHHLTSFILRILGSLDTCSTVLWRKIHWSIIHQQLHL